MNHAHLRTFSFVIANRLKIPGTSSLTLVDLDGVLKSPLFSLPGSEQTLNWHLKTFTVVKKQLTDIRLFN